MTAKQRKIYMRNWQIKNKEHCKSYRKTYRETTNTHRNGCKRWRANNVEHRKIYDKQYHAAHRDTRKERWLKKQYNITRDQFDNMIISQNTRVRDLQ